MLSIHTIRLWSSLCMILLKAGVLIGAGKYQKSGRGCRKNPRKPHFTPLLKKYFLFRLLDYGSYTLTGSELLIRGKIWNLRDLAAGA